MEQVEMEYWEVGIWKVHFLNKEDEDFTKRWSQNLVNLRSLGYLKEKTF